ncbi:MAG: redoxin domain-containing protein [Candidatus Saccharicenans sp.]
MKKKAFSKALTIIIISLSLIVCSGKSSSSQLTISPQKAKPGEVVIFSYLPANRGAGLPETLKLLVYSYSTELPRVKAVELKKSGKKWTGTYEIDKDALGLVAKVKIDRENEDTNQGKGYIFALFTPDGKIIPGHKAGLALAYVSWGQLAGISQDVNEALRLTEEDFQTNPEIKKRFVNSYLRLLQATRKEGWDRKAKDFLDEISTESDLDDSTLTTLYRFYAQTGDREKAMAIAGQAQKNPKGEFFQLQALMQLQTLQEAKDRMEFVKKFQAEFPDSKFTESIVGMVTQSLFQEGKLKEASEFLQENRLQTRPYYFYVIANQASQQGQTELALTTLNNGLSLLDEQLSNPEKFRPAYYTDEEWREEMEENFAAMMLSLKGNLLYKQGKLSEAVDSLRQAYEVSKGNQSGIAIDYARFLLENKNGQLAREILEATAGKGFTGQELMDLLKQAYVATTGSDSGWEEYKNKILNISVESLRSELKKKMVERPAPPFELKDLSGRAVKLADYKGKVVVLDFWATWCGPCLASFPGMKSLVEEFKNDPSVTFVFVNTWQDEPNKEQVVREFLEKNEYPFYVLMDTENRVVADYGVSGIPTKFVIDPAGKIRFVSIGFEGDTDKMIQEVKLMIELARGK